MTNRQLELAIVVLSVVVYGLKLLKEKDII